MTADQADGDVLRGFTNMSETMEPRLSCKIAEHSFQSVDGRHQQNRGTIDKYMGDVAMAFLGAPPVHQRTCNQR
jgi:class 3 adenylate cyclase